MRTVTIRNVRIVVPTIKITNTGKYVPVNHTPGTDTVNVGRLAVDNELTRMKYCV